MRVAALIDTYAMNCALNVCGGTAYINGGSFSGGQWCVSVVSGSNGSGHLYVAGGEFHGAASYALLVQHGGEAQLSGGTYTTTKGEYSIHHSSSSGKVNGLLASNYQYVNEKDEAATISDDQRGVVGNAKVVPKDGVVEYIGEGGTTQVRTDATELTGGNNILNDEWYVVTGNVTINDSLTISRPTVNLILCDKATLTVDILEVYSVFEQATLNVYLQKDGTGTLTTPLGTPPGDERELIIKSPGTPMKIVDDEGNKVTNIKDITEGGFTVSKCEHEGIVYNTQTPTGHEGTCDYCGTTVSGKHSFGAWEQNDADTHKAICTVCKFEKPAEHDFEMSALEDGQHHSVTCRTCNYQGAAAAHTYAENTKDYYNRLTCTGCGVFLAAEYNGGAVCPVTGGYRRGQG